MAKYEIDGLDEYIAKLNKLQSQKAQAYFGKALFEGAKIVADEIKKNMQALSVESIRGLDAVQKAGLIEGFGIAKAKKDGGAVNVKAGFHGYNAKETKSYQNGQANAMIARSIESGTSFSRPHPFVSPAVRKSRKAAEAKMKEVIERGITQTMEE